MYMHKFKGYSSCHAYNERVHTCTLCIPVGRGVGVGGFHSIPSPFLRCTTCRAGRGAGSEEGRTEREVRRAQSMRGKRRGKERGYVGSRDELHSRSLSESGQLPCA